MGEKCRAAREAKALYNLTDENMNNSEQRVLEYTGLSAEFIKKSNIQVGTFAGKPVFLNTVICDTGGDKPILVLVHGYGGSGSLFYKIIKQICTRFKLILVDLIGMGGSSRPTNFDDSKITPQ